MSPRAYKNEEIAEKMFISKQTVKNHLHNIFEKVGVSDNIALGQALGKAIHRILHLAQAEIGGGVHLEIQRAKRRTHQKGVVVGIDQFAHCVGVVTDNQGASPTLDFQLQVPLAVSGAEENCHSDQESCGARQSDLALARACTPAGNLFRIRLNRDRHFASLPGRSRSGLTLGLTWISAKPAREGSGE